MLLMNCAKKNKTRAPHDVLRREAILDEHAITKRQGGRRISTVFQSRGGDGGRSDIELTVINDDQNNQETANAAINSFSNPMRPNTSNPVGRRRRSSAPLAFFAPPLSPRRAGASFSMEEKVEQLMRDNVEIKKQLKEEVQKNRKQLKALNQVKQEIAELRTGKKTSSSKTGEKTNKNSQQRTKRLSKVMKARRNSAQSMRVQVVIEPEEVLVDETTGRRYSVNTMGESYWLDEEGADQEMHL